MQSISNCKSDLIIWYFYNIENLMLTACLTVRGKPSRINPISPLAWDSSRCLERRFIIISSEINFPWLTISASCWRKQMVNIRCGKIEQEITRKPRMLILVNNFIVYDSKSCESLVAPSMTQETKFSAWNFHKILGYEIVSNEH